MFRERRTHLEKVLPSAVSLLLLLTTTGQSAALTDGPLTSATPALTSGSAPTAQLGNSSVERPKVLRSHRSCGSEHDNYCTNGGQCMYPQDNDKPFCICTSSYGGLRCQFASDYSRSAVELEQLIAILFGVFMFILMVAIVISCIAHKKCKKSAKLIKSPPSQSLV